MDDLISRQMLLEYIHGDPVGRLLCDKYNLDGLIEQLPSAQPDLSEYSDKLWRNAYERGKRDAQSEIIRCKDCKHWDGVDTCDVIDAPVWDNDFCSMAERRSNE